MVLLTLRQIRSRNWLVAVFVLAAIAWPFQPIELSLRNADGLPHLVGYCSIRGPDGLDGAYKAEVRGECVVASDIVSGLDAKWFLVW